MVNKINKFKTLIFLICFVLGRFGVTIAQDTNKTAETTVVTEEGTAEEGNGEGAGEDEKAKKFNAGEMILEHVGDSHQWHLFGDHGHAVHMALPVILFTDKGLDIFSSSNVEHHGNFYRSEKTGYCYVLQDEHIEIINEATHEIDKDATAKIVDLSITKNVAALFLSLILMLVIFIGMANAYKRNPGKAPKGIQSVFEPFIIFIRDEVAKPSIGAKYEKYLPFLLTLFFFIWINNMLGLIPFFPGGSNVTGNIAVTMVLALFVFVITTFSAKKDYWIHIINTPGVPWWLKFPVPLMPIVELMGVISKPLVLTLRLFANITAGHIIVLAFVSLIFIFGEMSVELGYGVSIVSLAFAIFMDFMELLVAFLQAYVFTLLSAIYFGAALTEHAHEEHH